MITLFISLAVLIVLLAILYALSRKFPSVGKATGYVAAVLSNIMVNVEKRMLSSARYCHNGCIASLQAVTPHGHWQGKAVLRLCMYFALGCCILLGEVVSVMQVLHAMYPTMPDITSSVLAEFAQAAIWLCCPALFGDLLLTCCNIQSNVLFQDTMGTLSRWILGFVSFILLVFTIAVNAYFYMYRGVLLSPSSLDRQAAQQMIPYILTGLGLEVSAVSPFALLAIFEGAGGVLPLLLWIAEMGCQIIAATASFLPRILNIIATRIGGESVYNELGMIITGTVIDTTTMVRVDAVAIDSIQAQRLASSPQAIHMVAGDTIVTPVDTSDVSVDNKQVVLPGAVLHGHGNAEKEKALLPPPVALLTQAKPEKPEKLKLGVRRSLKLFDYQKEYLPTAPAQPMQVLVNGNNQNGSNPVEKEPVKKAPATSSVAATSRKRKAPSNAANTPTPVKPASRRGRAKKTTKTQSSTN